jgi:tetratricopeptide (TPR) repeat protein/DNA replication protein DnaC
MEQYRKEGNCSLSSEEGPSRDESTVAELLDTCSLGQAHTSKRPRLSEAGAVSNPAYVYRAKGGVSLMGPNPTYNHTQNFYYQGAADDIIPYVPDLDDIFVGRDEVVASLTNAFFSENKNVVLITGPPGIGKSEVAKAVCIRYLEKLKTMPEGSDGKCYRLELVSTVNSTSELYERLCRQLSGREIREPIEGQAHLLLRKLLPSSILFIDACENAKVTHIRELLKMAPQANGTLRFILTSTVEMTKHQLGTSIRTKTLEPISAEHALKILQHNACGKGSDEDMLAISDLLDGLPLALSLANCLLSSDEDTPYELRQALQDSSPEEVLSDERVTLGEQGLNKVLSRFFCVFKGKVGIEEYQLAISTSIFPGTFSRQAFQEVCKHSSIQSCSSQTPPVSRVLIGKLNQWHIVSSNGSPDPRYQMHSYLKHHAAKQVQDDVFLMQSVKRAFLSYFADLLQSIALEEAGEETKRTRPADLGLVTLDSEHENINCFLTLLTDYDLMQDSHLSNMLVKVMTDENVGQLLSFRFLHEKRIGTLKFFFQNVKTLISKQSQAGLLLEMAKILLGQGNFDEAISKAQEALKLCDSAKEDETIKASCLEVLGTSKFRQHFTGFGEAEESLKGAYKLTQGCLMAAEQQCQPDHDIRQCRRRFASVCKKLGELYSRMEKFDDSNSMLDKAKFHYEKISEKEGLSCVWLYHRIGGNLQSQQKFKDAETHLCHALELCDRYKAKNHPICAKLHYSLGRLYSSRGWKNLTKSLEHFGIARLLQIEINPFHVDVAQTYIGIGRVNNDMVLSKKEEGNLQVAHDMFKKAHEIIQRNPRCADHEGPPDLVMAELYSSHSLTYRLCDDYLKELRCLEQAWDVYEKLGDPFLEKKMSTCMTDMGHAHRRLGNKKKSDQCFAKARKLGGKAKGRQK